MDYVRAVHEMCKKHMNCHVIFQTSDRALMDGILLDSDGANATLQVPEEVSAPTTPEELRNDSTLRPRYRRYIVKIYPLASITGMYLYPYYYPYYPNFYPKPYPTQV
jgi:hypothetical protein